MYTEAHIELFRQPIAARTNVGVLIDLFLVTVIYVLFHLFVHIQHLSSLVSSFGKVKFPLKIWGYLLLDLLVGTLLQCF